MRSTTSHPTKVLNKCMPWSCNAGLPYVWHCQAGGYPVRLGAIVSSALLKAIATNHRLAILSHKMANFQIFFFCTDPCKRLLSSLKMRLVGVVIHGLPLLLKIFTSNMVQSSQERRQWPWPASEIGSANGARQQLEEMRSGDGFTCTV